jgi:hypothetical protein
VSVARVFRTSSDVACRLAFVKYLDGLVDGEAASLTEWLLPRLEKATVVGLRTGFLTLAGAEAVIPALTQVLERSGQVYAVVGGHPEQTDPAVLRALARVAADHPGRAMVYLATPGAGRQNGNRTARRTTSVMSTSRVRGVRQPYAGRAGDQPGSRDRPGRYAQPLRWINPLTCH